jgi:SPP1 gp7 family putative phage head morphogenesis protein
LKYVGDTKNNFNSLLGDAFRKGIRDARKETLAKKKKKNYSEYRKFQEIDLRHIDPKEALEYFNVKAFEMAGIERDFVLKKVKQRLLDGIKTGATTKDLVEAIETDLEGYVSRGIPVDIPEELIGFRLETVVRTNYGDAYNQGRKMFFEDPKLDGFIVAYQYSSILDDRVRPNHSIMDGRIYSVKNPIWDLWTPPNGFACRCILIPVTQGDEWEESDLPPKDVQPDKGFSKPGN